jgi:hypothetical protein
MVKPLKEENVLFASKCLQTAGNILPIYHSDSTLCQSVFTSLIEEVYKRTLQMWSWDEAEVCQWVRILKRVFILYENCTWCIDRADILLGLVIRWRNSPLSHWNVTNFYRFCLQIMLVYCHFVLQTPMVKTQKVVANMGVTFTNAVSISPSVELKVKLSS